eukprot:PhM_4_TR13568/c0_g1_i1/m.38659
MGKGIIANHQAPVSNHPQASKVLNKVRSALLERYGDGGILAMSRSFRIMDTDSNQSLTPQELFSGLERYGIPLDKDERREVLAAMDTSGDGKISATEFFVLVRGDNEHPGRRRVVERAWKQLDRDGSGLATIDDLRGVFSAKRNPLVLSGKMSEDEALMSFLGQFDDQTNPDGVVTWEEFWSYYSGVGVNIDNDLQFETLVTKAWRLGEPNSNLRVNSDTLVSDLKNKFRTSNYIPVGPAPQEIEGTSTRMKKEPRVLTTNMRPVVDPYPIGKPGHVKTGEAGNYPLPTQAHHKVKSLYNGDALEAFHTTLVRHGETVQQNPHLSRTINDDWKKSTAHEVSDAAHSDEVMAVFNEGRAKELAEERRRQEVLSAPLQSAEPQCWDTTNKKAYTYLLPAVDKTTRDMSLHATSIRKAIPGAPDPVWKEKSSPSVVPKPARAIAPKGNAPRSMPWVGGGPETTQKAARYTSSPVAESTPDEKDYLDTLARRRTERVDETHGATDGQKLQQSFMDSTSAIRTNDKRSMLTRTGNPSLKNESRPLNILDNSREPNMYVTASQLSTVSAYPRELLMKPK